MLRERERLGVSERRACSLVHRALARRREASAPNVSARGNPNFERRWDPALELAACARPCAVDSACTSTQRGLFGDPRMCAQRRVCLHVARATNDVDSAVGPVSRRGGAEIAPSGGGVRRRPLRTAANGY